VVVCNKSWKNDQCATNPRGRAKRSMDKIHPTGTSNQSQDNLSWAKVCRLRHTRRSRRSRKPRVKVSTGFLSQNPLGECGHTVFERNSFWNFCHVEKSLNTQARGRSGNWHWRQALVMLSHWCWERGVQAWKVASAQRSQR
jgi:hypothetical protein